VEFVLRPRQEFPYEGFLVDEASMVSKELYRDLLSFDLPVIFVGDHGQLPPVGNDVNVMAEPDHRLERIHRNAGPIAHFAGHLREGGLPRKFRGGSGKVQLVGSKALEDEELLTAGQIVCAFNKTRTGLNAHVRRLRGRKGAVQAGDRIICLRNSRAAGLFNGQQGKVVRVHKRNRLDFRSCGVTYRGLPYDPDVFGEEKPEIDYKPDAPHHFAYAVTCHKAQGSEWERLLVFEQICPHWEHSRWAYTAASRARRQLVWVAA
jgi:exodeoxyribonuclease V